MIVKTEERFFFFFFFFVVGYSLISFLVGTHVVVFPAAWKTQKKQQQHPSIGGYSKPRILLPPPPLLISLPPSTDSSFFFSSFPNHRLVKICPNISKKFEFSNFPLRNFQISVTGLSILSLSNDWNNCVIIITIGKLNQKEGHNRAEMFSGYVSVSVVMFCWVLFFLFFILPPHKCWGGESESGFACLCGRHLLGCWCCRILLGCMCRLTPFNLFLFFLPSGSCLRCSTCGAATGCATPTPTPT